MKYAWFKTNTYPARTVEVGVDALDDGGGMFLNLTVGDMDLIIDDPYAAQDFFNAVAEAKAAFDSLTVK